MNRAGVTLIELIVVLAVLSIMAGVVGFAVRPMGAESAGNDLEDAVARMRRRALASGKAADTTIERNGAILTIRALPDGRVLADTSVGVDPLTGRLRARSR